MRKLSFALGVGVLCLLQAPLADAKPRSLQWDRAFPSRAAPKNVHFIALYQDPSGRSHTQEVWRHGDLHLHRRTDNRLDLYVDKEKSGNYRYRLLDHKRRIAVSVSRESLYRIGVFSDWAGLAHVLARPKGKFSITRVRAKPEKTSLGECSWYQLTTSKPQPGKSRICWSTQWGIPLFIQTLNMQQHWQPQFSVSTVRTFQPASNIFMADTTGFIAVDADADLNPSTD